MVFYQSIPEFRYPTRECGMTEWIGGKGLLEWMHWIGLTIKLISTCTLGIT